MPEGLVSVDEGDAAISFVADASIYPLDAIYGAAFVFIDRCFVLLDRADAEHYRVTLTAKDPQADTEVLRSLVGEFANELLACAWRHEITHRNRAVIESVTMQAIGGAMGPPSLEELEDFDFTDEPFEDPLGIAQSWEEKYKKQPLKAQAAPEDQPDEESS